MIKNKKERKFEVLVAYTTPKMWELAHNACIAVQKHNISDADYVAFVCTGQEENNKRGVLRYYAKVIGDTEIMSSKDFLNKYEKDARGLTDFYKQKGWEKKDLKVYHFGVLQELSRPVFHKQGDRSKGQDKFFTTMEQIMNACKISDMKTISQLEKEFATSAK